MRNVVCISDIPLSLHDWFREEARLRSKERGKRVALSSIVVEALQEYKNKKESTRSNLRNPVDPERFTVSTPRAFLEYGALAVKSKYRNLLPKNQEGLNRKDRTHFTVHFVGYGETQAYMSQGRIKIKEKKVWREIVSKLGMNDDDTFTIKVINPSSYYEVTRT